MGTPLHALLFMNRRRVFYVFLSVLALFLLGTVVVLSSVTYYLAINPHAYLSELEVPILPNDTRWNATEHGHVERIPRILHQTWKTETLPTRWRGVSQACRDMMPDYEYMLWTDAGSREFIATHYPWFLETFDNYTYPIQRADVIRYFVLHYYGGIYIDLDIGCLRPLDPLLVYPSILPKTIPVGVSNDLMFAEKGHPLLEQAIHNLITFDHNWILNYPTVMFSTGPMFLSTQYGLYTSSHPATSVDDVRILPKSLYGKNAKPGEAPNSFFSHYYGSSWHADDAAFIGFLGTWGKLLMWIGLMIIVVGVIRLPTRQRKYSFRRMGYEILLPRLSQRNGHWYFHFGRRSSSHDHSHSSEENSLASSPIDEEVPVLHLPLDVRPSSPSSSSDVTNLSESYPSRVSSPFVDAFYRIRNRMISLASPRDDVPRSSRGPARPRYSRGVLFFLPAIFTQNHDIELAPSTSPMPSPLGSTSVRDGSTTQLPPEKVHLTEDVEYLGDLRQGYPPALQRSSSSSHAFGAHDSLVDLSDVPPRRPQSSSSRTRPTSQPSASWQS